MTSGELKKISPEDRWKLFDKLACKFYDTERYSAQLANELNYPASTVTRWRENHKVPFAVILLLHERLTSTPHQRTITDAAAQIVDAQKKLNEQIARLLSVIADHN